jgi:hypothetical protein
MSTRLAVNRGLRLAALSTAILATAGCGGGGGSSTPVTDPTPTPTPPAFVLITSQNQDAVARAAVSLFYGISGVPALPAAAPVKSSSVNGAVVHALGKVGSVDGGKVGRLAVVGETGACPAGGTPTMTIDDRDNNMAVTPGDVMTLTFANCSSAPQVTLNGGLSVTLSSYSEGPGSMQMSGLFAYQQLTLVDHGYSALANGAMNATYSETIDSMNTTRSRLDATVAASGMMGSGSHAGYSETYTYDPGFATTVLEVSGTAPGMVASTTEMLNGTVLVGSLGARIQVATEPATGMHRMSAMGSYPDAGRVRVSGKDSLLQLTAMDSSNVHFDLDFTNDGVFEASKDMAWSALMQ